MIFCVQNTTKNTNSASQFIEILTTEAIWFSKKNGNGFSTFGQWQSINGRAWTAQKICPSAWYGKAMFQIWWRSVHESLHNLVHRHQMESQTCIGQFIHELQGMSKRLKIDLPRNCYWISFSSPNAEHTGSVQTLYNNVQWMYYCTNRMNSCNGSMPYKYCHGY